MYLDDLNTIRHLILDVDGVLSDGSVLATDQREMWRTFNIKDGYALQFAVKQGVDILIISGGQSEGVRNRLSKLGIEHIYTGVSDKVAKFDELIEEGVIDAEHCLYMGDDHPDLSVMSRCKVRVCPADAVWEIKEVSNWITKEKGGHGAVREVIETMLKLRDQWSDGNGAVW